MVGKRENPRGARKNVGQKKGKSQKQEKIREKKRGEMGKERNKMQDKKTPTARI